MTKEKKMLQVSSMGRKQDYSLIFLSKYTAVIGSKYSWKHQNEIFNQWNLSVLISLIDYPYSPTLTKEASDEQRFSCKLRECAHHWYWLQCNFETYWPKYLSEG